MALYSSGIGDGIFHEKFKAKFCSEISWQRIFKLGVTRHLALLML